MCAYHAHTSPVKPYAHTVRIPGFGPKHNKQNLTCMRAHMHAHTPTNATSLTEKKKSARTFRDVNSIHTPAFSYER